MSQPDLHPPVSVPRSGAKPRSSSSETSCSSDSSGPAASVSSSAARGCEPAAPGTPRLDCPGAGVGTVGEAVGENLGQQPVVRVARSGPSPAPPGRATAAGRGARRSGGACSTWPFSISVSRWNRTVFGCTPSSSAICDDAQRRGRGLEHPQHLRPSTHRLRTLPHSASARCSGSLRRGLGGNPATSGVSTPSAPSLAAPPGEPSGPSRPGRVSVKNASLSARYGRRAAGRSSS